jgi:ABC-2 type transport system ATP-binding protein
MLNVQGIGKRFGRRTVLENVSFSVQPGEILGLIGPNGAGKTTLFECLAGLMPVDGGAISPADRKAVLYYVPDGIHPWPDQTLQWTTQFFELLFGRPAGSASRVVESLGLAALAKSPLGWLSKGELKRALLALGLLTPQPILMLDEPFDGLDLRQMREVMALFRAESRAGRTIFLSVHELGHAAQVSDRLVLLSGGRVAAVGTLDELQARAGVVGIEEAFLALT